MKAYHMDDTKIVTTVFPDDNRKYLTTDLCSDSPEEASEEIKILNYAIIS